MPDGTPNVPIEQVIALVARDTNEFAIIQGQPSVPIPPRYNALPVPLSSPVPSPLYRDSLRPLSSPRTPTMSPRTPSLFEMQTMGYGHRSTHVGGPRGGRPRLNLFNLDVDSPRTAQPEEFQELTPSTAKWPSTAREPQSAKEAADDSQAQVFSQIPYRCLSN